MDSKLEANVKENALARPPEEREMESRGERLRPFLVGYMEDIVFVEFSPDYLGKAGLSQLMAKTPVPLHRCNEADFRSEKGMGLDLIAKNMAWVIGIDPAFPHRDTYKAFIKKFLDRRPPEQLAKLAVENAEVENFDEACIFFRAALAMKWDDPNSMYGYARACRAIYNLSDEQDKIGRFKAEAFDYLELLTEIHPKFAPGWYYLGYMYLNMGLYTKTRIAWEGFLSRSGDAKAMEEIGRRLEQIKTPIEIERGYTAVMAGRWQEGLSILEPFSTTVYKDWWPLWHYLGEAYIQAGREEDAKGAFKKLLKLHGTHVETMESLIRIYEIEGDRQAVKKYQDKIRIIREASVDDNGETRESAQ